MRDQKKLRVLGAASLCLSWALCGFCQEIDRPADSVVTSLRISPEGPLLNLPVGDHPLRPALFLAKKYLTYAQNHVRDYSCQLVKRERVDDELQPYEYMEAKCRNRRMDSGNLIEPFSLYMKYLAPRKYVGREILYVENRDRGDALVRKGGTRNAYVNMWVNPQGELAMRGNRYPITEFGIERLLVRLIEVGQEEMQYDECEVEYYYDAKIDGRLCAGIEVRHPAPRDHFRYHIARVFIDKQLHVPIHFSSFTWPTEPGGAPILLEQYTYRNVKLNVGLTDEDFARNNASYNFRKE
jgi:hypothetical protein